MGLPTQSLRDRKKAATMHRIQHCAVDLFERHGFANVTVEQVAAAADVSPSTVYRYFGTKEYLVLRDERDDAVLLLLPQLLAEHDLMTAFEKAIDLLTPAHTMDHDDLTRRRVRMWFDIPGIRAAGSLMVDDLVDHAAGVIAAQPGSTLTAPAARVLLAALAATVVTAIRTWHEDDADEDELLDRIRGAVALVRQTMSAADRAELPNN